MLQGRQNIPIEIHAHVLSFLPPSYAEDDTSVKTLVSYLCASSRLRTAACGSLLWKPHYLARYTHCDEERERKRREEAKGNWYAMYVARRALDHRALLLVDEIRTLPKLRHENAQIIAQDLSFDVWDALEVETELPMPRYLRKEPQNVLAYYLRSEREKDPPKDVPHAMPRRYWAKTVLGVIVRYAAVRTWIRILAGNETVTFEDGHAAFSAFYDISPREISLQIDDLTDRCKRIITEEHWELDPNKSEYDLLGLCLRVRKFLSDSRYRVHENETQHPLNQFPHAFMDGPASLTTSLSIVWVFVAICRRLGIQASPTNYIHRVLCYVTSTHPTKGDILIDVCSTVNSPIVFSSRELPAMLARAGLPLDTPADYISPCSVLTYMQRVARKLMESDIFPDSANRVSHRVPVDVRRRARYAAWCCAFLFLGDEEGIRLDPLECFPLDPIAVLAAALCPVLPADILETVQAVCNRRIVAASEDEAVRLRSDYNVRWFVGLACVGDGFSGCIVGWMPIQSSDDVLYKVLTTSGSELYVREEEVNPLIVLPQVVQKMFAGSDRCSRYFEGACFTRGNERGRMLLSEELRWTYPEDTRAGIIWFRAGH